MGSIRMNEGVPVPYNASYAAIPESTKGPAFLHAKRRRMNIMAICQNLFVPWVFFTVLYGVMSFSVKYEHPAVANMIAAVCFFFVFLCGLATWRAYKRKKSAGVEGYEPTWFMYLFVAMAISWVLAMVLGHLNLATNMRIFFDLDNLNTYSGVSPSESAGQEFMDAGRIYFNTGAKLDLKKTIGFKNGDMYCVAPITMGNQSLASYDFWAVGLNCCSGTQSAYRCGEFGNPHAHAGLRLMRSDQRAFYRLAVQQAESMYNIRAEHPLFFVWLQDPNMDVNDYRSSGLKYFLFGVFGHFSLSLFCIACAVLGFSKIPEY